MEMPSSFCKIPGNFIIRKVFSLIDILLSTKIVKFDFRQDFMIDLGVGSGLKSQQDSLGCVSASLEQPKVVSFMNCRSLIKVKFFTDQVRHALGSGI